MDFSKYKIHIPTEKTAGSLLAPGENTFPLKNEEIYPYDEGIEIIIKECRGLWLPDNLLDNEDVENYFNSLGVMVG